MFNRERENRGVESLARRFVLKEIARMEEQDGNGERRGVVAQGILEKIVRLSNRGLIGRNVRGELLEVFGETIVWLGGI